MTKWTVIYFIKAQNDSGMDVRYQLPTVYNDKLQESKWKKAFNLQRQSRYCSPQVRKGSSRPKSHCRTPTYKRVNVNTINRITHAVKPPA